VTVNARILFAFYLKVYFISHPWNEEIVKSKGRNKSLDIVLRLRQIKIDEHTGISRQYSFD